MSLSRRAFLTAVGGGWAVDQLLPSGRGPAGVRRGASSDVGHLLRDGVPFPTSSDPPERCDVAILGGGVAGLAAAWRLSGEGLDVRVLELEPFVGGTSASGDDGVVPHPWGAHYLPAPNPEARPTLRLLEEMGVLTGWDAGNRPTFDPRILCHDPQERIFHSGRWHPGLVPRDALTADEHAELTRFSELAESLTARRGRDGRFAFQIPLALSSRDPELIALDRQSMAAWLEAEGFKSPFLRWYVRYATLDDFGAEPEDTSAWAGLHYFSARKLSSPELEGSHFLVWPEGNGRLVRALSERSEARRQTSALALSVEPERPAGVTVRWLDVQRGEVRRLSARAGVIALPAFVAVRLLPADLVPVLPVRTSSPWLVANLHVDRRPSSPQGPPASPGEPINADGGAWDSVLHEAQGLGYVDAAHQLSPPRDATVLTYFRAFGAPDVRASRQALLAAPWGQLADDVLTDLRPAHPDLRSVTSRLDLVIWGHAMPRPRPGFLGDRPFAEDAPERAALAPGLSWGHADTSGMALFEESQAEGVRAAEVSCASAGIDVGGSWL